MRFSKLRFRSLAAIGGVLAVAAALSADRPDGLKPTDKAFYADEIQASFIRPGLTATISKAEIAADGTVKAWVKFVDAKNQPLDRAGIDPPGAITASFLVAHIPANATQYVSYITRQRTVSGRTVTQATGESNGVWASLGNGEYTYTFSNKLPASYDKSLTHTIGIYATRNLDEFEMGRFYSNFNYNFVPAGGAVTKVRDIVRTSSCNKCHDQLAMHGGSRRTVENCILCHTPQTPDSRSDNTTDLKVMVHKIHFGENLPSVKAGTKYIVAGQDYSEIGYPSPIMACQSCHEPKEVSGATQADVWYTRPTRATCGSCHDNVNFATGENHAGIPQPNDNLCGTCHQPKGEFDFDISIQGAHVVPEQSSLLRGVIVKITSVNDAAPGKSPTINYTLLDKKGNPWLPTDLTNLRFYMAGPTTDLPSYVREDARAGSKGGNGTYSYTMTAKVPADFKGSLQFGVEGYKTTTVLEGTQKQRSIRDLIPNQVVTVSSTGGTPEPRRTVVSSAKCNKCHYSLSFHGGNRNTAEMCTFCHNPNLTEGTPAVSWNYSNMIHRFHEAEETRYPGNLNNCSQCHEGSSHTLPMKAGLLPVKNGLAPVNPVPVATNACTSCHTSEAAWSHAIGNTTQLGESCSVCHAEGKSAGVNKVHAQ